MQRAALGAVLANPLVEQRDADRDRLGQAAALLSELLGLLMGIAGGASVAPEFAADGGLVALDLGGDGADRGSPLVQGVDQAALVQWQMAVSPRLGSFSLTIDQSEP